MAVGLCPGEMCRVDRREGGGGQVGPQGQEQALASPRRLSEGSRLRLMSLRCMVGNYARCNENNKAGSIVVSKNTANAECLPGAFVCHLWVFALRPAGRREPRSAASRPSGSGFGLAGELQPPCTPPCPPAQAAEPGQVLAWEVRQESPGCIWEALVSSPLHTAMHGVAVGWRGFVPSSLAWSQVL